MQEKDKKQDGVQNIRSIKLIDGRTNKSVEIASRLKIELK